MGREGARAECKGPRRSNSPTPKRETFGNVCCCLCLCVSACRCGRCGRREVRAVEGTSGRLLLCSLPTFLSCVSSPSFLPSFLLSVSKVGTLVLFLSLLSFSTVSLSLVRVVPLCPTGRSFFLFSVQCRDPCFLTFPAVTIFPFSFASSVSSVGSGRMTKNSTKFDATMRNPNR